MNKLLLNIESFERMVFLIYIILLLNLPLSLILKNLYDIIFLGGKVKIGIDIDNVISNFNDTLLNEYLIHDKTLRNNGIINKNAKYIRNGMFDWNEEEEKSFYKNNIERIVKNLDIIEGAKEYIDKLHNDGHVIYVITGRDNGEYTDPYNMTKNWLDSKHIYYDNLILTDSYDKHVKSKKCIEHHIDVMIDDSVSICSNCINNGIKTILMDTPYNRYADIERVKSWKEFYEVISNMSKKKVILDTDMYNEIDDQFALTYLMKSLDVFDLEAITIAPFSKSGYANTMTIEDGTEKSYQVTLNILDMLNKSEYKDIVYKGATKYFKDSKESNEAVEKIIEIANKNDKTTILAIGAITNVALAIEKAPEIINKIKVVWLGGNTFLTKDNSEFNFRQDIPAVQKVFDSKIELVVIPCRNVASNLSTTIYELEHYLNKNTELNKYLCDIFIKCKKSFMKEPKDEIGSSKTLWDLSAIAYEINTDWFKSELISCPIVLDNGLYKETTDRHNVIFVNDLYRNKIYQDFFIKMEQK